MNELQELKAKAYDLIHLLEQVRLQLNTVNARIKLLSEQPPVKDDAEKDVEKGVEG